MKSYRETALFTDDDASAGASDDSGEFLGFEAKEDDNSEHDGLVIDVDDDVSILLLLLSI